MADDRVDPTLRTPRHADGAAGQLVDALRDAPPRLDDLARMRMERGVLEAWSMRPAARVPLPRPNDTAGRTPPRVLWVASIAAAALVGLGLGLHGLGVVTGRAPAPVAMGGARFELHVDDVAMQSGTVVEGQTLESGPHGRIQVDLVTSVVEMAEGTRVRFNRIGARELRYGLTSGRIDVDFHPVRRGEQTMAVDTRAARLLVVGTRFHVEVDGLGNTTLGVTEGEVEVVPRRGGASRRVRAGEEVRVGIDDGEAAERAVRASIERAIEEPGGRPDAIVAQGAPGVAAAAASVLAGADEIVADMDFSDEAAAPDERVQTPRARGADATVVRQLESAHRLLLQGKHGPARDALNRIAQGPHAPKFRVEALTLIAESFTVQGQIPKAREAYERAAHVAPSLPAGHNAAFALARLIERHTNERSDAAQAYQRYLDRAPHGALAAQAHDALCRLGQPDHCR